MSGYLQPLATLAVGSAMMIAAHGAHAQQAPRPSTFLCDPVKLSVTAWTDCLRKGQVDTDKAVDDALAKIRVAIDERKDLSAQQRTLLKRMMSESNDLWIRYRNHLCQNVMPILAGPKAKIYEENLACLIDMNTARRAELTSVTSPK
jgi:uncharacterized protein YecT (DUF1311 family)